MVTNKLTEQIYTFIQKHNLFPQGSCVVLGLSGGPDSIFLLHLLAQLHKQGIITLYAAHLDHEWRIESEQDVQFCNEATAALGIPLVIHKISELSSQAKWDGSQEEFGRKMRRQFLELVAKEVNASLIALAHHLQDQEETFFIRLIRGSSLTGLTAMRAKHGMYVRPLLEVNKNDIIAYLDAHNITYLTDPSNESPKFLRNRIRNTVLPPLRACDKRFDHNFLATLNRLKETEDFLEQLAHAKFKEITQINADKIELNVNKLFNLHIVMQYRLLMYWLIQSGVPFPPVQKFLDEIIRFLQQPGSKTHTIHEQWAITKNKEWATINHI